VTLQRLSPHMLQPCVCKWYLDIVQSGFVTNCIAVPGVAEVSSPMVSRGQETLQIASQVVSLTAVCHDAEIHDVSTIVTSSITLPE